VLQHLLAPSLPCIKPAQGLPVEGGYLPICFSLLFTSGAKPDPLSAFGHSAFELFRIAFERVHLGLIA